MGSVIVDQRDKHVDWYAKQKTLRTRRDAFLLDSSNAVIAAFVTPKPQQESLPGMWANLVKIQSEWSDYVYRKYPLTVSKTDVASVPGTDMERITRTAVYTYQYDKPDGFGGVDLTTATQTVVGTQTSTYTWHAFQSTPKHGRSVSTVWDNYANVDLSGLWGTSLQSTLARDMSLTMKTYYTPTYPTASYTEFPGIRTGSLIRPEFYSYVASSINGATPTNPAPLMAGYNPPYPNRATTERQELPLIVKEYRKDVPLEYAEDRPTTEYKSCLNDSHLWAGMKINVVLYGPKGKGIFGEWQITDTAMDVHGTLSLLYDHYTATLSFHRWTPATSETIDTPYGQVSKPLTVFRGPGTKDRTNAVIGLGAIPWPDVKRRASERLAAIKASRGKPPEEQSIEYLVLHALGRV